MKEKSCQLFFGALANEIRCSILRELQSGEKCVSDLVKSLKIKQSLISHNLKILAKAGLVHARRSGTFHFYHLNKESVVPAFELLERWKALMGYGKTGRTDGGGAESMSVQPATCFFVLDAAGKTVLGEGAGMEIVGVAPEAKGAGRSVFEALDDVPEALNFVRKALAGEAVHAHMSGRGHVFEVHMLPQMDGAGRVTGIVGTAVCIDERLRVEKEERERSAFYRNLVENLPDAVAVLDLDGRIKFMNREIGGAKPESVIGVSIYDFMPPKYRELSRSSINTVLQTCETRSATIETKGADGLLRRYNVRFGPLIVQGRADGLVVQMVELGRINGTAG